MGIGENIRRERLKNNMTQIKLAKAVRCLSQSQICKIEKGDRELKTNELVKIANVLDVSIDKLVNNATTLDSKVY